jgi:nitroimidazol reductase NimA-like FMN-containing flavoprotein (pyridoxamine 5'-phosphate oxidase superfamily)
MLDHAGLEVLDRAACLRLLATPGIGRLAVSVKALPLILPVHFVLAGDDILVRTHQGSTLDLATRDAVVAFEADRLGPADGLVWSVLVTGQAHHLPDGGAEPDGRWRELPAWTLTLPERIVAISTDHVSGRQSREP